MLKEPLRSLARDRALALRQRRGACLEPCVSLLDFATAIPGCLGVSAEAFYSVDAARKFESILGAIPYGFVGCGDAARQSLQHRGFATNTPHFVGMLDKCLDHLLPGGEMILVCSRRFATAACAAPLNERLMSNGTITHWIDLGDKKFFPGSQTDDVLLRYELGDYSRKTLTLYGDRALTIRAGRLNLQAVGMTAVRLGDFFTVHGGAISGCNSVFYNEHFGDTELVSASTCRTGKTSKVIFNPDPDSAYLLSKKSVLLTHNRRPRRESNWWKWQSSTFLRDGPRIYVCKITRQSNPFFMHECNLYDGSLIALSPNYKVIHFENLVSFLNSQDWQSLGFLHSGKMLFTAGALSEAMVNPDLSKHLEIS